MNAHSIGAIVAPRRLPRLVAAALGLAVVGCGATTPSRTQNIFGPDNRVDVDATTAPYAAVGRLDSGCTGTMIGRKLVLTAAHCVVDSATGTVKPELKYFRPALANGHSRDPVWIDYAWIGSEHPEAERARDWAILRVERPAGENYGRLAVNEVDFAAALPYTTNLVGYSHDRQNAATASVHKGCYIFEVSEGRLFHDCDGAAGVSGGPLLNWFDTVPHIVGITVSEFRRGAPDSVTRDAYSRDYANVAIPASAFAAAVRTLVQTIDVDIAAPRLDGVFERTNPNVRTSPDDPGNPDHPRVYTVRDVRSEAQLLASGSALGQAIHDVQAKIVSIGQMALDDHQNILETDAHGIMDASNNFDTVLQRIVAHTAGGDVAGQVFAQQQTLRRLQAPLASFGGWRGVPSQQARFSGFLGDFEASLKRLEALLFN